MNARFLFALLFLTATTALPAGMPVEQIPTETHHERLLKVEFGTLTKQQEKDPGDILVTVKTDKQSYYFMLTTGMMTPDWVTDLKAVLLKAKSVVSQGHNSGMVLHLLFPLRPDGTPDNPQGDAKIHPDINQHAKFSSREWSEETDPHLRGLYLTEFPATLFGEHYSYNPISMFETNAPCLIEIQRERPAPVTNTYFDGIVKFDPPNELERLNEANDPGDNPFAMRSKAVVFRPKGVNPANYQAINISVQTVGASIGNGKVVTFHPVSDARLKEEMIAANLDPKDTRITNVPKVVEATIAGKKALKLFWGITTRRQIFWQGSKYDKAETMIHEIYWIHLSPNQVLDVHLMAANETLLETVRGWLSTLEIRTPKE